jgi:hypothetical protein
MDSSAASQIQLCRRMLGLNRRGIIVYLWYIYQGVCPIVGIGSPPPPPPQAIVSTPLDPGGGGPTLSCE